MVRYGMVIDLSRCIGCGTCMVACKAQHSLPAGVFWNRILLKEYGSYPTVTKMIMPVLCNHCKDAACVKVCPTGATSRGEDGIITIDYDKCMGCRYCMIACPYGVRSFLSKIEGYYPHQGLTPYEAVGYRQFQSGVVIKCDFCQDKVHDGIKKGLKPGVDPEATPNCVLSCMSGARFFGDLDDSNSDVSRLIRLRHGYQLHPEFGTDPSVYYLA